MMTDETREDLRGKVLPLRELVGYQTGAVVSRMIVYRKSGTITLFAYDAGEGLSEHTAPYDAIVTVIEGQGRFTVGGNEIMVRENEMIIMPAGVPHAVFAPDRFKMMLTMIHE
jgi:quercetin dioxygenase-like cupin family protein